MLILSLFVGNISYQLHSRQQSPKMTTIIPLQEIPLYQRVPDYTAIGMSGMDFNCLINERCVNFGDPTS